MGFSKGLVFLVPSIHALPMSIPFVRSSWPCECHARSMSCGLGCGTKAPAPTSPDEKQLCPFSVWHHGELSIKAQRSHQSLWKATRSLWGN